MTHTRTHLPHTSVLVREHTATCVYPARSATPTPVDVRDRTLVPNRHVTEKRPTHTYTYLHLPTPRRVTRRKMSIPSLTAFAGTGYTWRVAVTRTNRQRVTPFNPVTDEAEREKVTGYT